MRLLPDNIWTDTMLCKFLYLITQTVNNIVQKTRYVDKRHCALILMNASN